MVPDGFFSRLGNLQNLFDFFDIIYECFVMGASSDQLISMAIRVVLSIIVISLMAYMMALPFIFLLSASAGGAALLSFLAGIILTALNVRLPRCN